MKNIKAEKNKIPFEITNNKYLDSLLNKINKGADINIKNSDGNTALIIACFFNYFDIAKLLIENGADINIQNDRGNTALIRAIYGENPDICKLLIENNEMIDIQNNDGDTALMSAAYYDNIDICKLLIEKGANLNAQDIHGNTALIIASMEGHTEICKLLIENGADINIENNSGYTPIDSMKDEGIYKEVNPYKILGLKYFQRVFKEHAEEYIDIFETTLYNQDLELEDIKANIEMFYSTVVARMDNNTINESLEL